MSQFSNNTSQLLLNSSHNTNKTFQTLIKLKFLFLIIKLILLICIYFTFDENLFSGLSLVDDRESKNYFLAQGVLISGVVFFSFFAIAELLILLSGYTKSFNKNNIIILSLNIFCIYLLGYFIFDAWHYVTIWYIFIVTQFPQTLMEVYGFVYEIVHDLAIYKRIKDGSLKQL